MTPVGTGNFAQNSRHPALSMQLGALGTVGAIFPSTPTIMWAQSMGADALTSAGATVTKTIASANSRDMKRLRFIIIDILDRASKREFEITLRQPQACKDSYVLKFSLLQKAR
ncbi:MAG: hypothetical protein HYU58_05050 [Proteobacteria bacterium]|nr:hypothetical protein [Pseudomonadota bacterium]